MKTKFILVAISFICACCASFFLGKASGKDESDEVLPAISKCDSTESVPSNAPTKPESRVVSEEEAVRIANESVDDILLMYAKDPIVLSTGRYKLVSFRIWINPNDRSRQDRTSGFLLFGSMRKRAPSFLRRFQIGSLCQSNG